MHNPKGQPLFTRYVSYTNRYAQCRADKVDTRAHWHIYLPLKIHPTSKASKRANLPTRDKDELVTGDSRW